MKLINWIKNLFSKKMVIDIPDDVYSDKAKRDIFGDIIQPHEFVYPIVYRDVKRRGYITIQAHATCVDYDDITDEMLKRGVIRTNRFEVALGTRVTASKRKGFYHFYCKPAELC